MRALAIESLAVRDFRNLTAVDLSPGPRFNVIHGANGQGKTNLLEAMYVACTSKGFRSKRPAELVRHDAEMASVRAVFRDDDLTRVQSVGMRREGARVVRIDEKRPQSLAAYATRSPVVVFHPAELALSSGASPERRRLLDRIALYLAPAALGALESYVRAVRERQRTLETRGIDAPDLEEWETLTATHGALVMDARAEAATRIAEGAVRAFGRIAAKDLSLRVSYEPKAPRDRDAFREVLRERRAIDRRRGSATVGPHRDELALTIDGHVARGTASQGQHRALVLALKVAEIEVIGAASMTRPILLLDDVSSELDRERTQALFAFLRGHAGQVFLTTTRPELIDTGVLEDTRERCDFVVDVGFVRPS